MSIAVLDQDEYPLQRRAAPNLPPLSSEDMARASALSQSLFRDDDHLDDIVMFGSTAHAGLTQISREMLAGVNVRTLDEITQLSDGVIVELQSLDLLELSAAAGKVMGIFKETRAAIQHRVEKFFRRWEMVNERLDRQEAEIYAKETEATERYHRDAALARSNYEVLREAHIMLMAIRIFLDGEHGYAELQRREGRAAQEQEAANRENRAVNFLITIAAERYASYIEKLEAKRTSLTKLLASAYHVNFAIAQMSKGENEIRQKLYDIRNDLLPMWRTNIALAYQAYVQHGIASFIENLQRAEDEIRYLTADQIEQAAKGIYKLKTQPFNVAALKYFNEKLISSMEIMKEASRIAKENRDKAEAEAQQLIKDLGDAANE